MNFMIKKQYLKDKYLKKKAITITLSETAKVSFVQIQKKKKKIKQHIKYMHDSQCEFRFSRIENIVGKEKMMVGNIPLFPIMFLEAF